MIFFWEINGGEETEGVLIPKLNARPRRFTVGLV